MRWRDGRVLGNGQVGAVVWIDGDALVVSVDHTGFWDLHATLLSAPHRFADFLTERWPDEWPTAAPRRAAELSTRRPSTRLELRGVDLQRPTLDIDLAEVRAGNVRVFVAADVDAVVVDVDGTFDWSYEGPFDVTATDRRLVLSLEPVTIDLDAHRSIWRERRTRSMLHVPEASLQSLWEMEIYKLHCATRPGAAPISLQGPWSPDGVPPAWGGDYHHNVNVQMSYSPVWTANRLDVAQTLIDWLERARPAFEGFARDHFGVDGQFVPSATDIDGRCRYEWATVNLAFSSGPWLAHLVWTHWLYTRDEQFRDDVALPFLRAVAAPLLQQLVDGHLPKTYSPEYAPSWGPDATIDLAFLRFLVDVLGLEVAVAEPKATTGSAWSTFTPGDPPGLWVRADQPYAKSHRHLSHLVPIHPLKQLRWDEPDHRQLITDCLRTMQLQGHGEWTGFTFPWAASICAHAGRPDLAVSLLRTYADHWVCESTLMVQGPPRHDVMTVWGELADLLGGDAVTLEAGFGFANALQELLLQSHGGVIRLFPAMPATWRTASFEHFLAEGAVEVSASFEDGHVSASFLPHVDGEIVVRLPEGTERTLDGRAGVPIRL
jgi:alpha-L-fucosidase 2